MTKNFKQTDIGLIPEDWNLVPLDDEEYFKTINGLWKGKKPPFREVTVIRNTNFTEFGLIDYSNVAVLDVEEKQYEKRKLLSGDIIIERSGGGPTQPVGRVVFFNSNEGEYSFSNFTSCLRTLDQDKFFPIFVFYSLLNFYLSGHTDSLQARTTGIRNLDFRSYKEKVGIPKLSLLEQKKIAYVLSKIQQAIETQEQIIKTAKELKKALMQKLFTEGLNGEPQKQTEIGSIPESWDVKRIDEAYVFTRKPRNRNFSKYRDVPFIPMELIPDTGMEANTFIPKDFKDIPSGTYFENGDLLLAKITPSFENGKQGIADINFIFGYATTEVIPIKEIENLSYIQYLHYYLKKEDVRKTLAGKMEGSTGRQRLPKGIVQATLIPFPKLSIQKKISSILNEFDYKIEITQNKINNLKELFKSSLSKLMTGQIRIKDIKFKLEKLKYH